MSPIDDELRRALNRRADDLVPAPDLMTGVTGTARRIRRRRRAATGAAGLLVLAAVAVTVPAVLPDHTSGPGRLASSTGPSTTPSVDLSTPTLAARPGVLGWPARGDGAVAERMRRLVVTRWSATHRAHIDDVAFRPLYARADGVSDVLIAQLAATGGPAFTVVAVAGQDNTSIYYDQPTPAWTVQISAIVPADSPSGTSVVVVVVADPRRVAGIDYTPAGTAGSKNSAIHGSAGEILTMPGPAGGTVTLRGPDGDVVSTGPVTYDGNVTAEPGETPAHATDFLDWASEAYGMIDDRTSAPALAQWTAAHPGRTGQEVRFLRCCADGSDPYAQIAQVRDDTGAIWDWAVLHTGSRQQVLLDRRTPADLTHIAVSYTVAGGPPTAVVVGPPWLGQVAYAADGQAFVPEASTSNFPLPPAGVMDYVFDRTGDEAVDALRIQGGDHGGPLLYQGPFDR